VDVLIIIKILMKPYKNKRTFPLHGDVLIIIIIIKTRLNIDRGVAFYVI